MLSAALVASIIASSSFAVYQVDINVLQIMVHTAALLPWRLLAFTWCCAEVAFYFIMQWYLKVQSAHRPAPSTSRAFRKKIFDKSMRTLDATQKGDMQHFKAFCQGWFLGTELDDLYWEDVVHWACWALFYKFLPQLTQAEADELHGYIYELERLSAHKLPRGDVKTCRKKASDATDDAGVVSRNLHPRSSVKRSCIRLNLDPVIATHRPLLFYVGVHALQLVSIMVLSCMGYARHRHGGFTYYIKNKRGANATSSSPPENPIILFHGLGYGLFSYCAFLYVAFSTCTRSVILVEFPYLSAHLFATVPTSTETVDAIQCILHEEGFAKATFIGHSFGTFLVNWVLSQKPDIVSAMVLIDPVSVNLCLPHVANRFLHERPASVSAALIQRLIAKEPHSALLMYRNFYWQENCFFLDDIPTVADTTSAPVSRPMAPLSSSSPVIASELLNVCTPSSPTTMKVAIFLAGQDVLVPTPQILTNIRLYHLDKNIRVLHHESLHHAQFLMSYAAMRDIKALVEDWRL